MQAPLHDILGEVAYLRRAGDILLQHVAAVERDIAEVGSVNPRQAADLAAGPARMLAEAKSQVEYAIGCVDTWRQSIGTALRASSVR